MTCIINKTRFECVMLAYQAARLNQARQSGREMGRVGKKEGVERRSVTETTHSALTFPPGGIKPAGNDVIQNCISGLVCLRTRYVIIYGISIDRRVVEELCTKHRLTTDRAERHRVLRAAEDNATLLYMRKLRHLASFTSSWQITHTTWSCFSGTMQFFNERTHSYS